MGAQLAGEEHRRSPFLQPLAQLLPGEGHPLAGGGGEKEVLRHPLHRQGHPGRAEALHRLLKALLEGAAGQGGGDEGDGGVGKGGVGLGHVEGPAPLFGQLAQRAHRLGQHLEGMALKIAENTVIPSGHALPQHLLAEGPGLAAAVEAGVVNDHQAAPHRYRDAGPEQVGPAPHPVGHVGHWEAEAQGGPALVGRRGEKKLHAGLHILGTPLSKF